MTVESQVVEVVPHEQVLLVRVLPRRLDTGKAEELENAVSHAVLARPAVPLVLDLSAVKFAPSIALGVFVNMLRGMNMSNRKAFFVGVNHQLRGTLAVTRLDAMITVRESLEQVLREL
ncbi:MAG TPA: STAS domain-containing protein [Phycisphaerae bacterium]|nr:STAS domain-containing protein [Phycisphaerales bacterium]HRX83444.1 STAS domain-containing protein [Phycisphaerae bacterium]